MRCVFRFLSTIPAMVLHLVSVPQVFRLTLPSFTIIFRKCVNKTNSRLLHYCFCLGFRPQSAVILKNLSASSSKHLSDDIRSIYGPLQWNQTQIHNLQYVTIDSPIEAFCNKSDGVSGN